MNTWKIKLLLFINVDCYSRGTELNKNLIPHAHVFAKVLDHKVNWFLSSTITPHSWLTSGWKATTIATNHIQISSFSWAFTWYHSWKELYGSFLIYSKSEELFLETVVFNKNTKTLSSWQNVPILKAQITESFKREVFSIQIDFFFYLPKNGVKSALREHYYFHT